jgi:hypothetical protein
MQSPQQPLMADGWLALAPDEIISVDELHHRLTRVLEVAGIRLPAMGEHRCPVIPEAEQDPVPGRSLNTVPGIHPRGGLARANLLRSTGNKIVEFRLPASTHREAHDNTERRGGLWHVIPFNRPVHCFRDAIGCSILVIVWHLSDPDARYADSGPDFYAGRTDPDRRRDHVRQLEALSYTVIL